MNADRAGEPTEDLRTPILTNESVEILDPRRKIRVIAVLSALAIVLCSASAAYVATTIAQSRMNHRVATLEKDLERRRAQRAAVDKQTQALLSQYRRTVCALLDGRDGPRFDELRGEFACDRLPPLPTPTPSPTPAPVVPQTPGPGVPTGRIPPGGGGGAPGRVVPTVFRVPQPTVAPAPVPQPKPQPKPIPVAPMPVPTMPPLPVPTTPLVCLPLVGCLL